MNKKKKNQRNAPHFKYCCMLTPNNTWAVRGEEKKKKKITIDFNFK